MRIQPPTNALGERERANFCLFSEGFIYASFYSLNVAKPDPGIYSYDTKAGKWLDSQTTLKTLAEGSMAAIVSVT